MLFSIITPTQHLVAGGGQGEFEIPGTDFDDAIYLAYFFDLRERESFIQITNTSPEQKLLHVQIFNVNDNCNENDFFDNYTISDTHVYNMRDIITNDGNPSGVILPDDAYGIVTITNPNGDDGNLTGNFRIIDNSGYEYRTNAMVYPNSSAPDNPDFTNTFNFNSNNGVTLSDVVGINIFFCEGDELCASEILDIFITYDIDIYDKNEVVFSCRDVIFACVDQDNPLYEELLSTTDNTFGEPNANVASFEYGINNAIPHSRGSELLCPGNTIDEGIVRMIGQGGGDDTESIFFFVGLNNGNGRGSMDSVWNTAGIFTPPPG